MSFYYPKTDDNQQQRKAENACINTQKSNAVSFNDHIRVNLVTNQ